MFRFKCMKHNAFHSQQKECNKDDSTNQQIPPPILSNLGGSKGFNWACICLECSLNIKGKSTTINYNERFLKHSGISMTFCIPQCSVSPPQRHLVTFETMSSTNIF